MMRAGANLEGRCRATVRRCAAFFGRAQCQRRHLRQRSSINGHFFQNDVGRNRFWPFRLWVDCYEPLGCWKPKQARRSFETRRTEPASALVGQHSIRTTEKMGLLSGWFCGMSQELFVDACNALIASEPKPSAIVFEYLGEMVRQSVLPR